MSDVDFYKNNLMEVSHCIFILLDENCMILQFNEIAALTFNKTASEVIGQNFFNFIKKSGVIFPSFILDRLQNKQKTLGFYSECNHTLNNQFILWNLIPNKSDEFNYVSLIGMPSTEHTRHHKELYSIINQLPHKIFWKDSQSIFMGCNTAFAESAGFTSAREIIGKTDFDMPWKTEADKYVADDQFVITHNNDKLNYEEIQTQPDGSVRNMFVSKVPMFDDEDNLTGVLGVFADITEKIEKEQQLIKIKEELERSNKAKDFFISMVSHELRTPLNCVLGTTDILSREKLTPYQQEYIQDIVNSGQNMLSLINDLIDFSRLKNLNLKIRNEFFNIKKSCKKVIQNFIYSDYNDEVGIRYDIDESIPDLVKSDELRFVQIIANLLSNASKFTEQGEIRLSMSCISKHSQKVKILFSVEDTGIGIPEDKLPYLFDDFYQVNIDHKYRRSASGLGLGLCIVKKILNIMGTDINVTSQVGQGTKFTFILDIEYQDGPSANHHIANNKQPEQYHKKVLLIEDDYISQKVAVNILKNFGFEIDVATTGKSALELIEKGDYQIIFTDIQLPDIDGVSIVKQIRPVFKHLIIAMTAYTSKDEMKDFLAIGINHVIEKPLSYEQVEKTLTKLLYEEGEYLK